MKLALSRYACVRTERGRLVADGPWGTVRVDPRAVVLIAALAQPRELSDAAVEAGTEPGEAELLAAPLLDVGVLVDAGAAAAEEESVWSFHDRLFHARTRPADRSAWVPRPPPAAVPERPWTPVVTLERPDLDAIERDDPPLARAQAVRTSQRVYAKRPLSVARLGEFLFRVGRVDDLWEAGGVTYASRPYPSAGALYELELYVALAESDDVEPGLYHYAADNHHLARVPASAEDVDRLVGDAQAGMGAPEPPPALLVIAARFPRIASKYGPLAYALVLKDVGVLMQTMCLSATAMGLAACAVGAGDAELFARATSLPIEEETSVGELCLGEPATPS